MILIPPKAIIAIAFLKIDLFLFSSETFLKTACNNNKVQKDIKNDKKIGKDLNKSVIATSGEPLTMEPTISAKQYIRLKNANAEKTKNTIKTIATIKDCLFCFWSNVEITKLSLSKNFFILPFHPTDEISSCPFVEIEVF